MNAVLALPLGIRTHPTSGTWLFVDSAGVAGRLTMPKQLGAYGRRSEAFRPSLSLAVPFSVVGAIWFLYLLGYNMSVAGGSSHQPRSGCRGARGRRVMPGQA